MLTVDTPQIQQNINTKIILKTDHENFVPPSTGTSANPTFTMTGTGGTIVNQYIVDEATALIVVAGTTGEALLTITDPLNNEAVTISVHSLAMLQSENTADGNPSANVVTPGDSIDPPAQQVPS